MAESARLLTILPTAMRPTALLALALAVTPAVAGGHVEVGTQVEAAELESLAGGRVPLLGQGQVNVLVFVRPGQPHSEETLRRLAERQPALAGKAVHLVAVAPAAAPRDQLKALVARAGFMAPVLLDDEDRVYGRLELRQHPVVVIADTRGKIQAIEPYQRLRYGELLVARVRFLLGELDHAELERVLRPERAAYPNEVGGGPAARQVKVGDLEAGKGHCGQAVKAYREALRIQPGHPGALAGLSRCGAGAPARPEDQPAPAAPAR